MASKRVVMGLSGGMDSSTLLGFLLHEDYEVHACLFTYGSKHNPYENAAAEKVAKYYQNHANFSGKVHVHRFDFSNLTGQFKSNLLLSGGEIPEGHYNDENMKKTVVPGRNLIFISIMAGLGESLGASYIALGIHAGDHHIYPDCRIEFAKAADQAIYLSSDKQLELISPFSRITKRDILTLGHGLTVHVPYHLTRTCYKDQELSCGKCGSCQERLEAFELADLKDPIVYAG
jgi:7-cyano-7-deazaguanine synthase